MEEVTMVSAPVSPGEQPVVTAPDDGGHTVVTAPDDGARKGLAGGAADAPAREAAFEKAMEGYRDLFQKRVSDIVQKRLKAHAARGESARAIAEAVQARCPGLSPEQVLQLLQTGGELPALRNDPAAAPRSNARSGQGEGEAREAEADPPRSGDPMGEAGENPDTSGENADSHSGDGQGMGSREGEDPAGESGEKSPQLPGEGQAQLEPHLRELLAVQARFDRDVQTWQRQARQVQALYGDFDLKKELADPTFRNLLKGGMGVQAAYEATHHRALLLSAMEHTARRVRDKTCRDIALRAARPQENAFAPGTLTRPDVYTMDKRQREDIERRVKQGERVML